MDLHETDEGKFLWKVWRDNSPFAVDVMYTLHALILQEIRIAKIKCTKFHVKFEKKSLENLNSYVAADGLYPTTT